MRLLRRIGGSCSKHATAGSSLHVTWDIRGRYEKKQEFFGE